MSVINPNVISFNNNGVTDGGLVVTKEMRDILATPGFIKLKDGGQRLRNLYVENSINFNCSRLSPFGLCCYLGQLDAVRKEVTAGSAPDLEGTETGYQFGYATLVVAGAQRVQPMRGATTNHKDVLKYLISCGLPLNIPDIAGLTALHHAIGSDSLQLELARVLLEGGANVNAQSRYGEVPLFSAFLKRHIKAIDLLLEFGADLDIPEADGTTPRKTMLTFGPQTTAVVQKWVRRRAGEEAPREEKKCDFCGKEDGPLKNCGRCQIARYCSVECQKQAWPEHKKSCQAFSSTNTLTFKPCYKSKLNLVPTQELANRYFGINTPTPASHRRSAHAPKHIDERSKNVIIKVQLPYNMSTNKPAPGAGPFMVYTKKRDFVCQIHRHDGPKAYDELAKIIVEKGVGGCKAYFTADLKSRDELIVKTEVLAEQPF